VVQSIKETLSSQFVENCKGVIQRLTLQEHKMVWNRTTHLWYGPAPANGRGALGGPHAHGQSDQRAPLRLPKRGTFGCFQG